MQKLSANDIRKKFLDFFASKGHTIIASDSVVPKNDPTVLFTTAGMQQFKRQFLGNTDGLTRAATSQKCIRTDDLDRVGKTNVHHTFFEMLGNFSFGDYFKQDAIVWAWEFLTQHLHIPKDRLWVSVYRDDHDALTIWRDIVGIPEHKIFKLGDKSNFWPSNAKQDGPNGPCGPCSEIFFDYHPHSRNVPMDPDDEDGRFAEIWNLVFTQFNRKEGGTLEPLPNKNIDTGMGLERLCAVLQGVDSNFDTDLFIPIIRAIESDIHAGLPVEEKRIIADHIRAATFAINDGIIPSNKERGSVVKTLINRSINLILKNGGQTNACVHTLVPVIVETMKAQYPDVAEKSGHIAELIQKAEEAFIQVWRLRVPELKTKISTRPNPEELGRLFFLYQDTFGLPLATSLLIARDEKIPADHIRTAVTVYDQLMAQQKQQSRAASKMAGDVFIDTELDLAVEKTKFVGYGTMIADAKVLRIFQDQTSVPSAAAGDHVRIVLDQTPFYAESGGQVGDTGTLSTSASCLADINDTQKCDDIFLHTATIQTGTINVGDMVTATVDHQRRTAIMRNHTATHLLQAALRKILGPHVQQQGSAVDDQRLRFDFTHPHALTDEQKTAIEEHVNHMIQQNIPVEKSEMSIDDARKKGALAFFAEKYGQTVRVVHVPGCSAELCGGTHIDNTGTIQLFKIISESAIAQGIRRIEAATASRAEEVIALKKQREQEAVDNQKKKEQEKERDENNFQQLKNDLDRLIHDATRIGDTVIICQIYNDANIDLLRRLSDVVKQKAKSAAILLGSMSHDNAYVIAAVTDDLLARDIHANAVIAFIAPIIHGKGGGRPQFAQAGSKDSASLDHAIHAAVQMIEQKLSNG